MTITEAELSQRARSLARTIEPFAGQVYFSTECHRSYEALGFEGSRGTFGAGVARPDGPAYFCSRGSLMGQVPGELVAAAFGVFNPEVVVPAVTYGWTLTDAATICAARLDGAIGQLTRLIGGRPDGVNRTVDILTRATAPLRPEGRPLFAGVRSQPVSEMPLAAAWQLADQLREFRGDSHINTWTTAGLDPVEIGLLTELYWGLPPRTYIRSRSWFEPHLDAAQKRLTVRGLLAEGALTDLGRAFREEIEAATDRQMRPAIDAIGDDFDELITLIRPWSRTIQDGHGYPATGPHELAELASGITVGERPADQPGT